MLSTLRIENYAIVSELELDFSQGMTAFTGETGAGKSIMIDALMLALGERADTSVIRNGEERCEIHATFLFAKDSEPTRWLAEQDIAFDTGEIILRRVITTEGRSKSYINGHPFPLQKVKELSEMLVDIHGQHQHQTLLQHSTHRQQLDQFAKHHELLDQVTYLFRQCHQIKIQLDKLQNKESSKQQIDLLTYQIEELSHLNAQEGEVEALHQEHQLLHHAKSYLEQSQCIADILNAEDTLNVSQALNSALQVLAHLPQENKHIKNTTELLNNALIQCEEALDEISQFAEVITLDPERLQVVEERMSLLHQVARKYQLDPQQLPYHAKQLQQEFDDLQDTTQEIHTLKQQYETLLQDYKEAAHKLRESRQVHAKKLAKEITQRIQKLSMPNGFITIQITPLETMQAHGMDRVEYKVCTNSGTNADSLVKIASGGELSRISLAIQMVTATQGSTPTLLFDEVDVGIGGATAALVGQLLRQLGTRLQVFCVTHQPQVAACSHQHFLVEKHSQEGQTFSKMSSLTEEDRVAEIARMLGGLTITEQTRSHAKELLLRSRECPETV